MLLLGGIFLVILATVHAFDDFYSKIVAVYYIAGFLFFIPGLYFSCKIYRAFKTHDKILRRDMLNDIPDM